MKLVCLKPSTRILIIERKKKDRNRLFKVLPSDISFLSFQEKISNF